MCIEEEKKTVIPPNNNYSQETGFYFLLWIFVCGGVLLNSKLSYFSDLSFTPRQEGSGVLSSWAQRNATLQAKSR